MGPPALSFDHQGGGLQGGAGQRNFRIWPFATVRGMQKSVWRLRHSGYHQSNADDHRVRAIDTAVVQTPAPGAALTARSVQRRAAQVACKIGWQRVRDN